MEFGLLSGRRVIGGVDHREIEVSVRVIGIHRDRIEQFLLRGLLPALLARGDSEIIMRRGAPRIDSERFC